MYILSNRRHPILASVLAFSLVVSLCAPPASAQSVRTNVATDDARRAPKDSGRAKPAARAPAKPKAANSGRADRAKISPAARASSGPAPKPQARARAAAKPTPKAEAPVRTSATPAAGGRNGRKVRAAAKRPETAARTAKAVFAAPARPSAAEARPSPPPASAYVGKAAARATRVAPAPSRRVVRTVFKDRRVTAGPRHYARPVIVNRTIYVAPRRVRYYRDVTVIRPYGHWYGGYGHFFSDSDAWAFLALTAITLAIVDVLSESQQRDHEAAQVLATTAPIGETITWNDGSAAGSVTPLRDGHTEDGAYCREFLQTVTIGGREEEAYGTACRKPDGAWEVVSAGQ